MHSSNRIDASMQTYLQTHARIDMLNRPLDVIKRHGATSRLSNFFTKDTGILMKLKTLSAALTLSLMSVGSSFAHHSYGMFDRDTEKTVSGVVQQFDWTNPHSRLVVLATNAKGAAETWTIEIGPPGQLVRTGWKKNSVKRGDKIDVLINPMKDGTPAGRLLMITTPDGQKLYDVVFKTPDGGRGGAAGVGSGSSEVHP